MKKDENKTKKQLISELEQVRQEVEQAQKSLESYKQMGKELIGKQNRFHVISELISDYAYILRLKPNGWLVREWITEANIIEITGYTLDELDALEGWVNLAHPEDRKIVEEHRKIFLSGEDHVAEYRIITKNGEVRWLCDYTRPIWSEEKGRVIRIVGAAQDITERKRTEQLLRDREKRFHMISELVSDYAYVLRIQPNGWLCREWVTDAISNITKYSLEELDALDGWVNIVHPEDREEVDRHRKAFRAGKEDISEYRIITKYDEVRWLRDYSRPILDENGEVVRIIGAAQDITKRKKAEKELKKYREHLEEIVEERTEELLQTNEQLKKEIQERKKAEEKLRQYTVELEARNEELDAFAHTVAHDLKAPLSTISGYSDLLEINYREISDDEAYGLLHAISRDAKKMNNIIEELLLLASVRKMKVVKILPLDMQKILSDVKKRLKYLISEYEAEIIITDSFPKALGYAPWVKEIWSNYLANAVKYGGKPPIVEIGAEEQSDGNICFWIKDNGNGISSENLDRLFTPFTRLNQLCTQEGYGLGLSIVQRIVHKLGGDVGVESELGEGSTFRFTLPKA